MSYDLFLRPAASALDEDSFVEYFSDRTGWAFPDDEDGGYVEYFNPATGVYFTLQFDAEDKHLFFSVNFYRCSPFMLEADMELQAMIEHFDLRVEDVQEHGIEGETYDQRQFFRGWSHGNRFAHRTVLSDVEVTALTYDGGALENVWRWNYNLQETGEENGGYYVVPPIGFVQVDGVVHTIFVYDVEQNMLAPRTDIVHLQKGDADVLVPWAAFEEVMHLEATHMEDPLDYWATLATLAEAALAPMFRKGYPSLSVEALGLTDVHAIDDVDQENHPDAYADEADDGE